MASSIISFHTCSVLTRSFWSRLRMGVVGVVVAVLVAAFLVSAVNPARAGEGVTPVVGSFGVGGSLLGGVDERTGGFAVQTLLLALPGVPGAGGGSVGVGVSYRQDLAGTGGDVYGLGAGWVWNIPRVDVDSGVRVSPASGGVFDADASKPSGLNGYVLEDLVFRQTPGVLSERDSVGGVEYAYSLLYRGGLTDYFNTTGDLVARVDGFGGRTDYVWDQGASHRLLAVVDGAGNRGTMNWTGTGVEVVTAQRSDGVVSKTVLEVMGGRLISVTDPTEEKVVFTYQDTGLLERVVSASGAVTEVSYQTLPNTVNPQVAVDRVRVIDQTTGAVLSTREWGCSG